MKSLEKKYYAIFKPYGMLSQFSADNEHTTLADLYDFPKDVYPVGRLDHDSEGLLILTNDKFLNFELLDPNKLHKRIYLVQVEQVVSPSALESLKSGVEINISGKMYKTQKADAEQIPEPELPARLPPVRFRENIPTSWIKLTIREGKNRQVRKMTAKVGFPTLRLVRWSIEELSVIGMESGDVYEFDREEMYKLLNLKLS